MKMKQALVSLDTNVNYVLSRLPQLPSIVRYYDDFADETYTIKRVDTTEVFQLKADGISRTVSLAVYGPLIPIVKRVLADWLHGLDLHSVLTMSAALRTYVEKNGLLSLKTLICARSHEVHAFWNASINVHAEDREACALRAFMHALCRQCIADWTPDLGPLIRSLAGRSVDSHKTVRTGECFLPLDHQAQIIDYIDGTCALLEGAPDEVDTAELWDACILVISFQYAFRPGQISRIETADLRTFPSTGAAHIVRRQHA